MTFSNAGEGIADADAADTNQIASSADAPPPSAANAQQNQATSTGESDKPEFPFFKERREPWFWFNNVAFLVCLAFFFYFTVTIVQDFIDNRNDPPTATTLRNGFSQSFPAMGFCIHRGLDPNSTQPDLQPLFAQYDNSDENAVDITDQLKEIDCPNLPQNQKCWYLDGNFSAFDVDCGGIRRNGISLGFTFNMTEYSREVTLLGIDGFLFESQNREQFFSLACPKCTDDTLPTDDICQNDYLGFESFFATAMTTNLIQLHRSETQANARCDTKIVQWNAASVAAAVNPKFLDGINVTNSASTVLMDFQFFSADITKTTFNPQSGVSMFGSLSGWFGFLSDGWGILSLLFIVEELITYCFRWRGRR